MQTIVKTIVIAAPPQTVWDCIVSPDAHQEWSSAFSAGSHFVGAWQTGKEMRFLTTQNGKSNGLISRIAKAQPPVSCVIEHIGIVQDGQDLYAGAAVQQWLPKRPDGRPPQEAYFLQPAENGCRLTIQQDVTDSSAQFFFAAWDNALQKLARLAQRAAQAESAAPPST